MGHGPIAPGEPVVLDLFPRDRESGCYADMTRTFVVGEPSEESRSEYQRLCREALEAPSTRSGPACSGRELHRLICDFFERARLPDAALEAAGRGARRTGSSTRSATASGSRCTSSRGSAARRDELVAGDVVAIEPGLYRSGWGGCRLEDLVLVTEDGGELLTDFPYDLAP